LAVLLIAGIWYWQVQKSANAAPTYLTHPVARGNLSLTVTANGTLQPVRTTSIGSELSGTVLKVNVDVNDVIKKGQVLVELDTAKLRDQILRSRAAISAANARVAQAAATVKEARACPAARCRRKLNWMPAVPPWPAPWLMPPAPRPASAMQKRRCPPT
jgi:HlyD family secretion protein